MISKKQKTRTVILVCVLVVAIIAGVFAISYSINGYKAPWKAKEAEVIPEESQVIIVEKEEPKPEPVKEDPKPVEKEEEPVEVVEEVEEEPEVEYALEPISSEAKFYGALHVEDGKLVDKSGNAAKLTGVSTHGLSWFPEYASADTIKYLKDVFKINTIRLAMYTSDYNGYCVGGYEVQASLKDTIDAAVLTAKDNDMYVIIDWHILNDQNPNEYKSDAIQFFGEMVRRYSDFDNVIYEICNEPNGETTWADIKSYATEVIPVIRNVDKDAIVLVGTPNWCQDIAAAMAEPLDFENIMYTYHFYAASHKSKYRNTFAEACDANFPVFVSEFGLVDASGNGNVDTKEAEKWLEMLNEYNISACIWNLSNKDEGAALINNNCDKLVDFTYDELSPQGQYMYDYLVSKESNN